MHAPAQSTYIALHAVAFDLALETRLLMYDWLARQSQMSCEPLALGSSNQVALRMVVVMMRMMMMMTMMMMMMMMMMKVITNKKDGSSEGGR